MKIRRLAEACVVLSLGTLASTVWARSAAEPYEVHERRAVFNYQMHCQGCHTPTGAGKNAIPPLKNMMGHFTKSDAGRAFLVRVPGSASSKLNDADLAEVINWSLLNFAGDSMPPEGFEPFSAEEVGELRRDPLQEIIRYRALVLSEIAALPE